MRPKLILPVFLSAFFLSMGALQLNDPDPLYWVTVYAMTALIPHGRLVQPHYASLFWITAGMVFAGLLQSFSGFIDFMTAGDWGLLTAPMTDKLPAIEYAREFLGLLFSVACLVAYRKLSVSD